jgi:hypothetical protein
MPTCGCGPLRKRFKQVDPRVSPDLHQAPCPAMDISNCRGCRAGELQTVLDLGNMPLANGYLGGTGEISGERKFPLELSLCRRCFLAQVPHTVPRDVLFRGRTAYYSSYSASLLANCRRLAAGLIDELGLGAGDLVVEIASNDGYLLQYFREPGIRVLGVEPAAGPAAAARSRDIPVVEEFFDGAIAEKLLSDHGRPRLVIASNVLAHVENLHDVLHGLAILLDGGATAVLEVHYLGCLIDQLQFDTIYHEHICYFSVGSLRAVLDSHDLHIRGVEQITAQGGSLRVSISRQPENAAIVQSWTDAESARGLNDMKTYLQFAQRVGELRRQLPQFLDRIRAAGHRIAAYGAAAKGTILLNACGLGSEYLDFVVDANPHKQGLLMPGVHIPILPVAAIADRRPDCLLILPWNLEQEIVGQQQAFLDGGGRFIVPLPVPRFIPPAPA